MNRNPQEIINKWNDFKENYAYVKNPFFILLFIYLLGISAIIRADFNYIDDMGRVAHGYKQWDVCSRYISYYLSGFIHGDNYLTDVSPLPQFLAVVLLVLSSVIVICLVSGKKEISLWQLIGIMPLGLSPYFLECISYKYDSVYMALSVFVAIIPLVFRNMKMWVYGVVSALGIIAVCTTYQAATGIFPMLVILLAVKDFREGKKLWNILQFLMLSVAGYGVGLIIFKLFIMVPVDTYVSNGTPDIGELFPTIIENFQTYFGHIRTDFKTEWLFLMVVIMATYIWVMVRETKRNKILTLIVTISALVLMCLLIFGIYPVLSDPLFGPRAMYGVGVLLSFLATTVTSADKIYLGKTVCFLLSWYFFVFAFTYGNALSVQSTYTDFRISQVLEDLNEMEIFVTDEKKTVQISGTIGYSPILKNMPQDYKMLNRLVPITFRGDWYWGTEGFLKYYGLKNCFRNSSIDLRTYDLPVVKDTMYHTVKAKDNYVLIELK